MLEYLRSNQGKTQNRKNIEIKKKQLDVEIERLKLRNNGDRSLSPLQLPVSEADERLVTVACDTAVEELLETDVVFIVALCVVISTEELRVDDVSVKLEVDNIDTLVTVDEACV